MQIHYINKYASRSFIESKFGPIVEEVSNTTIENIYIRNGYYTLKDNVKSLIILMDLKFEIDTEFMEPLKVSKDSVDINYYTFIKRYKLLDLLDFLNIVSIVKPVSLNVSVINNFKLDPFLKSNKILNNQLSKSIKLGYDPEKDVIIRNPTDYVKEIIKDFKYKNYLPDAQEILAGYNISLVQEEIEDDIEEF